jgi:hypothetical protein
MPSKNWYIAEYRDSFTATNNIPETESECYLQKSDFFGTAVYASRLSLFLWNSHRAWRHSRCCALVSAAIASKYFILKCDKSPFIGFPIQQKSSLARRYNLAQITGYGKVVSGIWYGR